MQAEITSDDSIIRYHYQHQNVFDAVWPGANGSTASVTGWYGLHFANRPCPPLIFYACQSNTVMTTCIALLPNKTQISLWWLRSLIHCSTEAILLKASHSRRGGRQLGLQSVLMSLLSLLFSTAQVLSASVWLTATVREQYRNQSFPLRRCDLLLAFICVSVQKFKLLHEKFIPGSQGSKGSPVICRQHPKSSDC